MLTIIHQAPLPCKYDKREALADGNLFLIYIEPPYNVCKRSQLLSLSHSKKSENLWLTSVLPDPRPVYAPGGSI